MMWKKVLYFLCLIEMQVWQKCLFSRVWSLLYCFSLFSVLFSECGRLQFSFFVLLVIGVFGVSCLWMLSRLQVRVVVIVRYGLVLELVNWFFMCMFFGVFSGMCRLQVWLLKFQCMLFGEILLNISWWQEFMFGVKNVIVCGVYFCRLFR